MIIPDAVRRCVGFVMVKLQGVHRAVGTCFFILRRTAHPGKTAVYAVTAKHVIDGISRTSDDGIVYLRLNDDRGGASTLDSPTAGWWHNPEPSDPVTDVAIAPLEWRIGQYDHVALRRQDLADPANFDGLDIGVGRDLFLTGLFVNHQGVHRNIPIIRTGSIAAMPEEPVKTSVGSMRAYLVECRSVGGLSGSPVFVHLGQLTGTSGHLRKMSDEFYLLGIMHGHWNAKLHDESQSKENSLGPELVNMGIGIVLPAEQILSAISSFESRANSEPSLLT